MNHLRALKAIGSTAENLKEAMSGEVGEFEEMSPRMISGSQAEGHKEAERTFNFANEVEKIHAQLFRKDLETLERKEDVDIYVCGVCGYTVEGNPPDICTVCKAQKKTFRRIG